MMRHLKFPYTLKSKIILLITFILLILAGVQFVVLQWVRRQIISEVQGITHTINRVSEEYMIGQSRKYDTLIIHLMDSLRNEVSQPLQADSNRKKLVWKTFLGDSFSDNWRKLKMKGDTSGKTFSIPAERYRNIKIRKLKITGNDSLYNFFISKNSQLTRKDGTIKDNLNEDINIKIIDSQVTVVHRFKNGDSDSVVTRLTAQSQPPQWVPAPEVLHFDFEPISINQLLDNITHKTVWINAIFLILTLGIIVWIIQTFLKPVEQLGASIREVERGNLKIRTANGGKGELADLSRSFNRMVAELYKSREKETLLKQKEHLAALGQLAAGVAHEIKNPLNAILLNLQQLEARLSSGRNKQKELSYVRTIFAEINRLDSIVNNMLDFIRQQNPKKEPVKPNQLLTEIVELLSMEFDQAQIHVSMDLAVDMTVLGDKDRLKTAFLNIVLNALQATPEGGQISIRLEPGGKILIQDTGVGIPENQLDRVWDLFYTTRNGGNGMGLPTAHKIISDHGGEIFISSSQKAGTTVEIQLPTIEVL